jgi:ribosomal protein S18 acetylase RimI-like enzyme
MNKSIKRIALISVLCAGMVSGVWYYASHMRTPVSDFEFTRDIDHVLTMFKDDWYWLDASRDQFEKDYVVYKFKNRAQQLNPLYNGSMRIKVIREDNQLAGFITYHKEGADGGRILYLDVKPAMRGKRYGEILMRYAMDDLIRMDAKKIRLVTRTDNLAAQKLYNRVGFVETSSSDGFVNFEYTK